ncbi:M15 family metallopeptidase [Miniphocaeibacter halophilus]|uniref:D-alanyl-D-alanine carboxypeptidase family protein n=1 Tax=Miniphocaeibacter halophilus TaxID=2931922 RepID=A0AC61MR20_9FIRM|nr:M15 family metallopeptidase [Miniphocaeibacter halophilus]QQK08005.1 D-alanyl-D-alanine carboxypeptidase family protein [Miniphocaeibacter halophilus]
MSDKKRKSFSDINKKYSFLDEGVEGLKNRNVTRDEEARRRTMSENSEKNNRQGRNQQTHRNPRSNNNRQDFRDHTIKMDAQAIEKERRRVEMKARREREQKRKKRLTISVFLGIVIVVIVAFAFKTWLDKGNAKTNPIVATEPAEKKQNKETDVETLKGFVVTTKATKCFEDSNDSSTELKEILAGEYLEKYGTVDEFTKIKYQGTEGYVHTVDITEISKEDELKVIDGILIVNNKYTLPEEYEAGKNSEANTNFDIMVKAAKTDDVNIKVASDYRSYELQKNNSYDSEGISAYGEYLSDGSQVPAGASEHQTGLAFDVYGEYDNKYSKNFADSKEYKWLKENAHKYGFIIRYPEGKEEITGRKAEPWHLRYVGTKAAKEIHANNQTLEEYLGLVKNTGNEDENTNNELKENNNSNNDEKNNSSADNNSSNNNDSNSLDNNSNEENNNRSSNKKEDSDNSKNNENNN